MVKAEYGIIITFIQDWLQCFSKLLLEQQGTNV